MYFDINIYQSKYKVTILKIYGPNNKQDTVDNTEFMTSIYDTIDTKGSLVTVLTGTVQF